MNLTKESRITGRKMSYDTHSILLSQALYQKDISFPLLPDSLQLTNLAQMFRIHLCRFPRNIQGEERKCIFKMVLDSWDVGLHLRPFSTASWAAWVTYIIDYYHLEFSNFFQTLSNQTLAMISIFYSFLQL